jgi:hypothetical protein
LKSGGIDDLEEEEDVISESEKDAEGNEEELHDIIDFYKRALSGHVGDIQSLDNELLGEDTVKQQ